MSTPIESDPPLLVPGVTGDLVADDYGVPIEEDDFVAERTEEPRFKSRYMADRERRDAPVAGRRRTPDHRYVIGELRRIALTASFMIAILVVATLVLR
ncbi:MAG: hypothetical protein GEU28_14905 [Dehalococcoidia bacterium]|nr:hypothetical protein [Dehalococcoidia bacterium]